MVTAFPRRGEIHWIVLNPVAGAEMGKTRPALVVQNDIGNEFSRTTIVATISSRRTRSYPFLVPLPDGVLSKPSVVNCAHVRTVDLSRLVSGPVARLDADTMRAVDVALQVSLGIATGTDHD